MCRAISCAGRAPPRRSHSSAGGAPRSSVSSMPSTDQGGRLTLSPRPYHWPGYSALHFSLVGQQFICIDGSMSHDFGFTPSISLYVHCETGEEIDRPYVVLVEGVRH